MDRRHILIVHRYFWPENISETPYLLKTIADMHRARGDRVTIVTGASVDFTEKWAGAFGEDVTIRHFRAPNDRGMSLPRKLLSLIKLFSLAARTIAGGRFDLVYTISYPPGFSAAIILLSRAFQKQAQVVYYVQDILSYRIPPGLLRRIYRAISGWTIAHAGKTVTLSPTMKQELEGYLPAADRGRIEVIPNCFAFDGQPAESAAPRRDIIYAGAHGKSQNLHHFLEVIAAIPADRRPTVAFFGDGDEKASLKDSVARHGLSDWVEFNDPVPRERIMDEIRASRLGLVGAVPGLMNYAFPSKIANYTSAGTPVLVMCEAGGAMEQWLEEHAFGTAIDPTDVDQAAASIMAALSADGQARQPSGAKLQEAAGKFFGVARYRERLSTLIEGLLGGNAPEIAPARNRDN